MIGRRARHTMVMFTAALGAISLWTVPPAHAQGLLYGGPNPCGDIPGGDGQGQTGGTQNEICQGAGVVFIGPAVGQVASVVGPTIIGPTNVGAVNVSAGDIAGNAGSSTVHQVVP